MIQWSQLALYFLLSLLFLGVGCVPPKQKAKEDTRPFCPDIDGKDLRFNAKSYSSMNFGEWEIPKPPDCQPRVAYAGRFCTGAWIPTFCVYFKTDKGAFVEPTEFVLQAGNQTRSLGSLQEIGFEERDFCFLGTTFRGRFRFRARWKGQILGGEAVSYGDPQTSGVIHPITGKIRSCNPLPVGFSAVFSTPPP